MKLPRCLISWGAGLGAAAATLIFSPGATAEVPQPSPDAIHRRLNDILSRPEFAPEKEPSDNWFRADLRWVAQRIIDFFDWLGSLQTDAPLLFWLLMSVLVLLLIFLTVYVGRRIGRILYLGARPRGEESAHQRRQRLSLLYRAEADRWAGRGDFTEAIRYLFLSLVYRFDEAGRVNFQQACTNREYLALFAQRPRASAELKVFVDTLDDHWYGERPTDQARYEECRALYDDLSRS